MAHTCPECGSVCYCHGDIDDIVLDTDEAVTLCDHCPLDYDYEDDDEWDDYGDAVEQADGVKPNDYAGKERTP